MSKGLIWDAIGSTTDLIPSFVSRSCQKDFSHDFLRHVCLGVAYYFDITITPFSAKGKWRLILSC